jgi:hypothetical protein
MKLAAIYNVFDAEELLPYSIQSIKHMVDEIVIVYQTVSNCGNKHPNDSFDNFISDLGVEHLIHYTPKITNHPYDSEINERNKRGIGCKRAMELGCTHFLFVDCDELYDTDQFLQAKEQIIQNDYDSSACQMATYYKSPTYRLTPNEEYYVPFITKLQPGITQLSNFGDYPVVADPTRKAYPWDNFKKFDRQDLEMHHFTMVRKDVELKFRNNTTLSSRNYSYEELVKNFNDFKPGDKLTPPFENYDVKVVSNKFNIPEEFSEYKDEDFTILTKICEKLENKLDYWLSSGTFLSLYRENRFFPWDTDLDIDLKGDNLNEDLFISLMTGLGLKLHSKKNSNGRLNQIIFTHPKIERLIDFYIWYKKGDQYVADCDVGHLYYPASLIDNIYSLRIRDSFFMCPNPEEYFTLRYGEDWRTPKRVSGLPGGGWDITKNLVRKK